MKKILVTGCAGFIGFHTCKRLLEEGYNVLGIDNLNEYYDVTLKESRLNILKNFNNFNFIKLDFSDSLNELENYEFDIILHLGAQAGVRYSLTNPHIYTKYNIDGTLNLLEFARKKGIDHFIFASSSSVYGNNKKFPFSESDTVNEPISLYADTKRAGELMCYTYNKLFGIKCSCLRFFTVYGPYGRPDMAMFRFVDSILNNKEIELYNYGNMRRDFTFIKDIVDGILKLIETKLDYEIINLGNSKPADVKYVLGLIENELVKKANVKLVPIQQGDVPATFSDISKAKELLDWEPKVSVEDGVKEFVKWYREYYRV